MVQANNIIQDDSFTNQDGNRTGVISITVITVLEGYQSVGSSYLTWIHAITMLSLFCIVRS